MAEHRKDVYGVYVHGNLLYETYASAHDFNDQALSLRYVRLTTFLFPFALDHVFSILSCSENGMKPFSLSLLDPLNS